MSKRQELRQQHTRQKQRQRNILILSIAGFAILLAALLILPNYLSGLSASRAYPQANQNNLGDPSAPVKVVEFSDYLCSHCRDFALESQPRLVEEYVATGKVYFTYTPFSFFGPDSQAAAAANYCAMDQGKYWPYHDLIFRQVGTSANALTSNSLIGYAAELDLDTAAFEECVTSGKYTQKVLDDLAYGQEQGVEGTPSFLVNDQLVYQAELFSTIESELAKAGASE